ncbi:hypothetical protein PkP19E3_16090 [Pseudomonas koreensis]|nr:hypothetical protein PkP19E3_16090 [Pseudomonas koreensis]
MGRCAGDDEYRGLIPDPTRNAKPCGSWLASDGGLSVNAAETDPLLSLASQLPQNIESFADSGFVD